jgi:hypothetical protein
MPFPRKSRQTDATPRLPVKTNPGRSLEFLQDMFPEAEVTLKILQSNSLVHEQYLVERRYIFDTLLDLLSRLHNIVPTSTDEDIDTHEKKLFSQFKTLFDHLLSVCLRSATTGSDHPMILVQGNPRRIRTKRPLHTAEDKALLMEWFREHGDHPYPTSEEKRAFAEKTNMTYEQVAVFFVNTRIRKWKKFKFPGECRNSDSEAEENQS